MTCTARGLGRASASASQPGGNAAHRQHLRRHARERPAASTASATAPAAAANTSRGRCASRARCDGDAVVGLARLRRHGPLQAGRDASSACRSRATRPPAPASTRARPSTQCVSGRQCEAGSCGRRMKGAHVRKDQTASAASAPTGSAATSPAADRACRARCRAAKGPAGPSIGDQPDPHGMCRNAGAAVLRSDRAVRRLRRLRQVPARHGVHRRRPAPGTSSTRPGPATASAPARRPGIQNCHPFRCAERRVHDDLQDRRRLRRRHRVRQPHLRSEAGRAAVRQGERVPVAATASTASAARARARARAGAARWRRRSGAACRWPPATRTRARCARCRRQSTCGTNGKCDGSGGCQKLPGQHRCAPTRPASSQRLQAGRRCATPAASAWRPTRCPCAPFICNGNKCFNACTNNAQCVAPNTCINNSCGLKDNGASCSATNECKSGFCAQGVCCDQACTGACKSCVAGMLGVCSNVATGTVDPAGALRGSGRRRAAAPTAAARRAPASATPRGRPASTPTCPTTTNLFTALSTCNGAGACVTPGRDRLLPVSVRHERVQAVVHRRRRLQAAGGLRQRHVRPQAAGRDLLRRRGVPVRLLRAGRLLPDRAAPASASRARSPRRAARAATRRTGDTDARCADMGPASCGTDGLLRRQRRVPPLRRQHVVRGAVVPGQPVDADHRPHLRRPRRLPGGVHARLRALRLQRHDGVPGGLHGRRRLPGAATSATRRPTAAATRSASARRARRPTSA